MTSYGTQSTKPSDGAGSRGIPDGGYIANGALLMAAYTLGFTTPDKLSGFSKCLSQRLAAQTTGKSSGASMSLARSGEARLGKRPPRPHAPPFTHGAVCPRASERKSGGIFFRGRWATPLLLAAGMNRRVASGAPTITGMSCHRH